MAQPIVVMQYFVLYSSLVALHSVLWLPSYICTTVHVCLYLKFLQVMALTAYNFTCDNIAGSEYWQLLPYCQAGSATFYQLFNHCYWMHATWHALWVGTITQYRQVYSYSMVQGLCIWSWYIYLFVYTPWHLKTLHDLMYIGDAIRFWFVGHMISLGCNLWLGSQLVTWVILTKTSCNLFLLIFSTIMQHVYCNLVCISD